MGKNTFGKRMTRSLIHNLPIICEQVTMRRLSVLLASLAAALIVVAQPSKLPFGSVVTWDHHSLLVDGRRVCPVMGEIHYSRVPADEWAAEVAKMREGGVTIVATYVFWNHIEEQEGIFDWSGQHDLRRFLEVCKSEGMPVVLRMGPWCHGEARNGGLPDWLFSKSCRMRSQDSTFLEYTCRLYRQIFAQVQGLQWKDGGPVIAAQFDNEYRGPAEYLLSLKRMALSVGFDLPFYTRTGWPELSTPMPFGEMIPLFGDYADGFWDKSTKEGVGSYYKAFNFKEQVKPASNMGAPGQESPLAISTAKDSTLPLEEERGGGLYPYFTCELGGGMATSYHRRPYVYAEDAYALALVKLGSGSNLLGYYMYHGGTNPAGKLHSLNECQTSPFTANNDLPVCTYDFQAPLGEFGQANPHYYRLRPLHLFMHDFGELLAPMEASFPCSQDLPQGDGTHLRWSVRSDGQSAYVFINNYERFADLRAQSGVQLEACGIHFPTLTIPAGCSAIFPVNVAGLRYATAQLVAQRDGKLYLMAVPGISSTIALQSGKVLKNVKPSGPLKPVYGNIYLLTLSDAEQLFLSDSARSSQSAHQMTIPAHLISKVRESGSLRPITKGRAKVASAPAEEDWQQAAVYRITLPADSSLFKPQSSLLSIVYRGDCARLYAVTSDADHNLTRRLIADNFYYGRPFLYGLWRLPAGCRYVELLLLPLQADAPIYLPREADRTPGEALLEVKVERLKE